MIFEAICKPNTLILGILNDVFKLKKTQKDFFIETMFLFLSIRGKINFLQLGRYGEFGEQRYRQQFEKQTDFLKFNVELVMDKLSQNKFICIAPSFINKSGKHTPSLSRFWSGVARFAQTRS